MQTCSTASGGVYFVEESIARKTPKKSAKYSDLSETAATVDAAVLVTAKNAKDTLQVAA